MEVFLYSTILFLFLESLCDPLYHWPALPVCGHMFLYLAVVLKCPILVLWLQCLPGTVSLASFVFSLTFCRGSPGVSHASLFVLISRAVSFPICGEARLCQGSLWQLSVFTCSSHPAVLTEPFVTVIGETSRHTDFPSFLTRTLASGLHVFQSLPCRLTRLSTAFVSARPQCHLLCILETHFWSVLMCSLVLSVSIFLVCGLRGR